MAVGPLIDSFTGFTDWHGKELEPKLTYRQMRRYLNLSRAVFSYIDLPVSAANLLGLVSWLLGFRSLYTERAGFDKWLGRWFLDLEGGPLIDAVAEVVKFTCRSYLRIQIAIRGSLLLLLSSGIALLGSSGKARWLWCCLLLISMLSLVILTHLKCRLIKSLCRGGYWSIKDRRFVKVLFRYSGELIPQVDLTEELATAVNGLGLTGNGYEIINALAPKWESSFRELIDTVNSLSI